MPIRTNQTLADAQVLYYRGIWSLERVMVSMDTWVHREVVRQGSADKGLALVTSQDRHAGLQAQIPTDLLYLMRPATRSR